MTDFDWKQNGRNIFGGSSPRVGCGSSMRIASLSLCGGAAGTTGEGWIGPVSSTIGWAKDHVPAIVEAWYPGEFGGQAYDYFSRSVGELPAFYNSDPSRMEK